MRVAHLLSAATLAFTIVACSKGADANNASADSALALTASPTKAMDSVSTVERTGSTPVATATPTKHTTVVHRTSTTSSTPAASSSTSGNNGTSAAATPTTTTTTTVEKHTNRDAAIGAGAGAVLGAVTSKNKVKGAVIGGAAGGILGAVIGNNVDKTKKPQP